MSNVLYPKAKEDFLAGNLNLSSNTVTIALVDTGVYTFSSAHEDRADIPNSAVISTSTLASTSITGGVFDADDANFTSVMAFGGRCRASGPHCLVFCIRCHVVCVWCFMFGG